VPEGRVNTGYPDDDAVGQYSRTIVSGMLRPASVIRVTTVAGGEGESVVDAGGTGRGLAGSRSRVEGLQWGPVTSVGD
jgi:hypothetical protein